MSANLITNGTVVTWQSPNELLTGSGLLIENGQIREVGDSLTLERSYPDLPRVDASGQLIMPGNICAHTHFYGALARGMAIPGDPPADFPAVLRRLWWRLDRALSMEDVRYSALVSIIDAIKHGTTTLIDHHASPNAIGGSLETIAQAVEEAGVRAALCYEVTDRNGRPGALAGIEENVDFLKSVRVGRGDLLRGLFGLHASLSIGEETLAASVEAASALGSGLHIHAAEHEADQEDSLARYGKRVVERLSEAGVLGRDSILAHAVHVDDREMDLLAESGTWVTHQPRSNMNNGVGAADIELMLQKGIRMALGNDGFGNNMWAEWKAAYLLHKVANRDPRKANGADIAAIAAGNNSTLVTQLWDGAVIGRIEPGAAADIILVNYQATTPLSAGNLPWHIIFGFESSMVTSTMVAGEWLMRDRQLLTLNEERITARSRELASGVWKRFAELSS